jgi:hypothetical protein
MLASADLASEQMVRGVWGGRSLTQGFRMVRDAQGGWVGGAHRIELTALSVTVS